MRVRIGEPRKLRRVVRVGCRGGKVLSCVYYSRKRIMGQVGRTSHSNGTSEWVVLGSQAVEGRVKAGYAGESLIV